MASEDLSWLLTGLVNRVPHTRSALLLSSDGLVKAAEGLDTGAAEEGHPDLPAELGGMPVVACSLHSQVPCVAVSILAEVR